MQCKRCPPWQRATPRETHLALGRRKLASNGSDVNIVRLDHLVLTVRNIEATCAFYEKVLRMKRITFAGGRLALAFGQQKINLHPADAPITPHALHPTPGSADLCSLLRLRLP